MLRIISQGLQNTLTPEAVRNRMELIFYNNVTICSYCLSSSFMNEVTVMKSTWQSS